MIFIMNKVAQLSAFCLFISPLFTEPAFGTVKYQSNPNTNTVLTIHEDGNTIARGNSATGGLLTNYGTVDLKHNIDNQTGTFSDLGAGDFIFSGTTSQTISGPVTFQNLTLNNPDGVTTVSDIQVNGVFTLTNGRLTLGGSNLLLGNAASIAGTPSASAMVVATGTGELRRSFPVSPSFPFAFTFPVGDVDGTAEYSPVTVNFTSGTFGSGNYLGVSLKNEADPFPGIATGNYLNRYWILNSDGITGSISCDLTFKFTDADVSGVKSNLYCIKTSPALFEYDNYLSNNVLNGTVSTFSRFTGADQLVKTNLKLFLEGLYNPATGQMNKAQDFDGGGYFDKYEGTIADVINVELHDGLNFQTIAYSFPDLELQQNGTLTFNLPKSYMGSYYTVLKHRNHIETVSMSPVSYNPGMVSYDFSTAAGQAFGNNQKQVSTGIWGFFTGDVNQDGIVNLIDLSSENSAVLNLEKGYLSTDLNGDGIVNLIDLSTVNSATLNLVTRKTP